MSRRGRDGAPDPGRGTPGHLRADRRDEGRQAEALVHETLRTFGGSRWQSTTPALSATARWWIPPKKSGTRWWTSTSRAYSCAPNMSSGHDRRWRRVHHQHLLGRGIGRAPNQCAYDAAKAGSLTSPGRWLSTSRSSTSGSTASFPAGSTRRCRGLHRASQPAGRRRPRGLGRFQTFRDSRGSRAGSVVPCIRRVVICDRSPVYRRWRLYGQ